MPAKRDRIFWIPGAVTPRRIDGFVGERGLRLEFCPRALENLSRFRAVEIERERIFRSPECPDEVLFGFRGSGHREDRRRGLCPLLCQARPFSVGRCLRLVGVDPC